MKTNSIKRITVSAGVIINEDKVLLTRRAPTEKRPGGWEFPGGKLEPGEAIEDCLIRELDEELGIQVSILLPCKAVVHEYEDVIVDLVAEYCTITSGTPTLTVHDRCEWVHVKDLLDYNLLPADIPIAKKIQEDMHGLLK